MSWLLPQESTIFEPTTKVLAAAGVVRLSEFRTPPKQPGALPVYELRRFHLQPGARGGRLVTPARRGALVERVYLISLPTECALVLPVAG